MTTTPPPDWPTQPVSLERRLATLHPPDELTIRIPFPEPPNWVHHIRSRVARFNTRHSTRLSVRRQYGTLRIAHRSTG